MNKTKICCRCHQEKSIGDFCKNKTSQDGLEYKCKLCSQQYYLKHADKIKIKQTQYKLHHKDEIKLRNKLYYLKNKEEIDLRNKKYYMEHKEGVILQQKKYLSSHKEKRRVYLDKYMTEHKEKIKTYTSKYNKEHKSERKLYNLKNKEKYQQYRLAHEKEIKKYRRQYELEHKKEINIRRRKYVKNNLSARIIIRLRSRIQGAIKHNRKSKHTVELIMCSIPEFKTHIEKQWLPGMSWDNWGCGENKWHIDHIIPCSFFDMSDPVEQHVCFRYQNQQPLWQPDNLKKSDKISP